MKNSTNSKPMATKIIITTAAVILISGGVTAAIILANQPDDKNTNSITQKPQQTTTGNQTPALPEKITVHDLTPIYSRPNAEKLSANAQSFAKFSRAMMSEPDIPLSASDFEKIISLNSNRYIDYIYKAFPSGRDDTFCILTAGDRNVTGMSELVKTSFEYFPDTLGNIPTAERAALIRDGDVNRCGKYFR